jgi:hypothetical protein
MGSGENYCFVCAEKKGRSETFSVSSGSEERRRQVMYGYLHILHIRTRYLKIYLK